MYDSVFKTSKMLRCIVQKYNLDMPRNAHVYTHMYIHAYCSSGLGGRVFANGREGQDSIPCLIIPKNGTRCLLA